MPRDIYLTFYTTDQSPWYPEVQYSCKGHGLHINSVNLMAHMDTRYFIPRNRQHLFHLVKQLQLKYPQSTINIVYKATTYYSTYNRLHDTSIIPYLHTLDIDVDSYQVIIKDLPVLKKLRLVCDYAHGQRPINIQLLNLPQLKSFTFLQRVSRVKCRLDPQLACNLETFEYRSTAILNSGTDVFSFIGSSDVYWKSLKKLIYKSSAPEGPALVNRWLTNSPLVPLKHLNLQLTTLLTTTKWDVLPINHLSNLEQLKLCWIPYSKKSLEIPLPNLKQLKLIDLAHIEQVTVTATKTPLDLHLAWCSHLTQVSTGPLKSLSICGCPTELEPLISHRPQMDTLHLISCGPPQLTTLDILDMPCLQNLTIKNFRHLKKLHIRQAPLLHQCLLEVCPDLISLYIQDTPLLRELYMPTVISKIRYGRIELNLNSKNRRYR